MSTDGRSGEIRSDRNKILKVLIGVVGLVGLFSVFLNYLTLELPILGSYKVSFLETLKATRFPPSGHPTGIVRTEGLNVREQPSVEGRVMGMAKKGSKVTLFEERGEWRRIATSVGDGWVNARYLDLEEPSTALLPDIESLLKELDIEPTELPPLRNLPPHSSYLPGVSLAFLLLSLVTLPFVVGQIGLVVVRVLIMTSATLAAYSLVFHLLFVQAVREAMIRLAKSVIQDASSQELGGALAGALSTVMIDKVNIVVGPALYLLTVSGLVGTALSLFLVNQDVGEETISLGRYLDL
jgi:hypothetical protein